jgi:gamma-glutamyl:cysteine ligase YbdK (ATP-grasp superfamily)
MILHKSPYKLFECVGIELEYMLVNQKTLQPEASTDKLIIKKHGAITDELENGLISWSNELVLHVVELKTTHPVKSLDGISGAFHANVEEINKLLAEDGVMLMPTAMHPFLNPLKDLKLWPHHRNEIYEQYDKIFNCKGHGWGNLQSMHINLPFANDDEFFKLHEAIRILMPLIPALSASSPIYEGNIGPFKDNRLNFYELNQQKIPAITGKVIPESVKNKKEYEEKILEQTYKAIAPFDTDNILQEEWLNSRGAITRFDRNAIEIRIIDLQECPVADIAIAELIIESLKWLIKRFDIIPYFSETELYPIYRTALEEGSNGSIENTSYVKLFGFVPDQEISIRNVWKSILAEVRLSPESEAAILNILTNGNLSERIVTNLNSEKPSIENIIKEYKILADCLKNNRLYTPRQ